MKTREDFYNEGYKYGLKKAQSILKQMSESNNSNKGVSVVKIATTAKKALKDWSPSKAWDKAKKIYAIEILTKLYYNNKGVYVKDEKELKKVILSGARDWRQLSKGGSYLVNNNEIAQRVCSPSALKAFKGGDKQPSGERTWLDVQATALEAATDLIISTYFNGKTK